MPAPTSITTEIRTAVERINEAWREHRPEDMEVLLHPDVVMVLPDFSARAEGREVLIESFRAFDREARVVDYRTGDLHVDGDDGAAVAQYRFEMVYERAGSRWRSTGWDVWAFSKADGAWRAVWRTMQGLAESPA